MIDVILPTLGRPDKLAALTDNVHASTRSPHSLIFVVEVDDWASQEAIEPLDSRALVGTYGSCAAAVNAGYRASSSEFFAIANDDCRFEEGWDEAALAYFSDTVHIVGLNDGSGDCKCFQIARRSFIEEHSGVYDKPDTVYHTYTSQCCDTEFAFYAQKRGVWADAPDAVVEHEHWRFGKADPNHPNYEKARASNAADLATYAARRREWDPQGTTPMAVPGA